VNLGRPVHSQFSSSGRDLLGTRITDFYGLMFSYHHDSVKTLFIWECNVCRKTATVKVHKKTAQIRTMCQLGLLVERWSRLNQQSYSTLGPVSTGIGDRLRAGKPPRFVTTHSGQLSLLPTAGSSPIWPYLRWKGTLNSNQPNNLPQDAKWVPAKLWWCCLWGVKAGMVHSTCG